MSRVKRVTWRWSQNPRKVTRVFPEEGSLTRGVKARAGQEGCLPDGEDAGPKRDGDSSRRWRAGTGGRARRRTPTVKVTRQGRVQRWGEGFLGNLGWV